MWEVVRAILGGIPRHSTVVELLDPFGRVGQPTTARDGEGVKVAVLDVSLGWLGEGVYVSNEAGFKELDRLLTVIQLLFVVCFLCREVLLEVVGVGF